MERAGNRPFLSVSGGIPVKLKLIETIRNRGIQHRPPSVIDTQALGISDEEAAVLVRRGTAKVVAEPAPAPVSTEVQQELAIPDNNAVPAPQPDPAPQPAPVAVKPAAQEPARARRKR